MLNRIQRRSLDLIDVAPDIVTRNYWLMKLAISDKAHPKIIARIREIYESRLFLEFDEKSDDRAWSPQAAARGRDSLEAEKKTRKMIQSRKTNNENLPTF